MLQAKIINGYSDEVLTAIMHIEEKCFPNTWYQGNEKEHYKEMLDNDKAINIILLENESKIVGYLLAIPHNDAISILDGADPLMREDADRYYIETVGILREFRKNGVGLDLLLEKLDAECKKRGVNKISMHARVYNCFSAKMQKRYKTAPLRQIPEWKFYNFEEPTDYIEANLD